VACIIVKKVIILKVIICFDYLLHFCCWIGKLTGFPKCATPVFPFNWDEDDIQDRALQPQIFHVFKFLNFLI
jgi:hypothetical protein